MKNRILRCARKRFLGLLSLCLVLTVTAWAQVQTGRIVGSVADAQKAALPNATVTVTEGSRLQFRAEAFNVTNTPSFNAPNTAIDTSNSTGGLVTSTASLPRQIQFALKYNF